jgi:hypothetical protein
MCYFYDGKKGLRPEEYSTVGIAYVGEISSGWSLNDLVRITNKNQEKMHKYRICYVLLL